MRMSMPLTSDIYYTYKISLENASANVEKKSSLSYQPSNFAVSRVADIVGLEGARFHNSHDSWENGKLPIKTTRRWKLNYF